jgi:hypothetical protein
MALNIRVNNARAMSFEPNPISPNIIGGFSGNSVGAGVAGATISGGGAPGSNNVVTDDYGTIGGGQGNQAGDGDPLLNDETFATVSGGSANRALSDLATVGGGGNNTAGAIGPVGDEGDAATVGGGFQNTASGRDSTVSGGFSNTASGDQSTVGGGSANVASGVGATVGGGGQNAAINDATTVAGGSNNGAGNPDGTGFGATVGGGYYNRAWGAYSTVPGGQGNAAVGNFSFAAGRYAIANNQGAFVWADATGNTFFSGAPNEFAARASGGFRLCTTAAADICAILNPGSATWAAISDRALKENITPVDKHQILHKLSLIPITMWNFKSQDPSIKHIGPMAQDFYAAFGLGESDTTISTVDADGIALISIQALYELSLEKDKQIEEQARKIEELEARLAALEQLVKELSAKK